ncbi:hypothetical protein GCM10007981_14310 [Thermocladium modestius]|uniref:Nodulation protein NfeD n=2 Tax=Thermocladium modestius TaxID=62609 RepID=A0A830GUX3_9CREN|nr:hypothetical protein GCM10007981_14310 [Thermocladium modestius]
MMLGRYIWLILALLPLLSASFLHATTVYVYNLNGEITSTTYEELASIYSGLPNGSVVVIEMQTPGGELDAALNIVQLFETSNITTIGYVYPSGSYAWSGGTLVLLATDVAAMAPGTVIGSCQPVEINPLTGQETFITQPKIINAVAKYFEETAQYRGRNATFAMDCVYNDTNLDPEEALRYGVINAVASNLTELLSQINGTQVNGRPLIIRSLNVVPLSPSISFQLYEALSNPVTQEVLEFLAILLILVGVITMHLYLAGIGAVVFLIPIVIGLSINYAALALLIIGIGLIALEWHGGGKAHGILMGVGAAVIVVGIVLLAPNLSAPSYELRYEPSGLSVVLFVEIAIIVALVAYIIYIITRAVTHKPISRRLILPTGKVGIAVDSIKAGGMGTVKVEGEYWRAKSLDDVAEGDPIVVVDFDGYVVTVRKSSAGQPQSPL